MSIYIYKARTKGEASEGGTHGPLHPPKYVHLHLSVNRCCWILAPILFSMKNIEG